MLKHIGLKAIDKIVTWIPYLHGLYGHEGLKMHKKITVVSYKTRDLLQLKVHKNQFSNGIRNYYT